MKPSSASKFQAWTACAAGEAPTASRVVRWRGEERGRDGRQTAEAATAGSPAACPSQSTASPPAPHPQPARKVSLFAST